MDLRAVLLAEDDPRDADMTARALRASRLANELVVVEDGVQALEYLRREGAWAARSPGLPAVVLLDIKMPRKDGLEVLREIRADPELRRVPVVILTSSREDPDLEAVYDLGVNAYVVKPVGLDEFIGVIKQIGAFWAVLNELPSDRDHRAG